MTRIKNILLNAGLAFGSLAVFFLIAELVVFRFIFPATDIPRNAFIDGIIRHEPNQEGIFRLKDGLPIPYAINSRGWNSAYSDYDLNRRSGVERIAVIGDSFVEALQVPHDQSFANHLERELNADSDPTEVYRFGISGAPLSQYVHMLENEIVRYSPDLAVILLIHNDFDESFGFKPGRYTSSFLKLDMHDSVVASEIAPVAYEESWKEQFRRFATFRYLYYQQQLKPELVSALIFDRNKRHEANVEIDKITDQWGDIEAATDYLLSRLAAIADRNNIDLLLVMDANREEIYAADSSAKSSNGVAKLSKLATRLAAEHGIPFLHLEATFRNDWEDHHVRFEFPYDNHWNQRGHKVAGEAIADYLRAHP